MRLRNWNGLEVVAELHKSGGKQGVSPGSDYGGILLVMGAKNKERPQQKVYCTPGEETEDLDFEEMREK